MMNFIMSIPTSPEEYGIIAGLFGLIYFLCRMFYNLISNSVKGSGSIYEKYITQTTALGEKIDELNKNKIISLENKVISLEAKITALEEKITNLLDIIRELRDKLNERKS